MRQIEGALNTLQRQLDPGGQFAPPVSTMAMSERPEAMADVPPAEPVPQIASPPPRSVPAAAAPSGMGAKSTPAPGGPAAPPPRPARSGGPKMVPILIAAIGVVLLAGAGAGVWYFRGHLGQKTQVATVAPAQPVQPAPPAQPSAAPPENPADATNPAANAVPPLAPLPPEPAPEPKKAPRARKRTEPAATAPAPAPVVPAPTPVAPPPAPVERAAEPPKAVKSVAPHVQMVPVMIQDGMPFRITLAQDVPANSPDGSDVRFTVLEDFHNADNIVVIAKGATVTGKVTAGGGKKFLGMGGNKIGYELEKVDAVDGKKLNVRALAGRNAEGNALHPFETPNGRRSKGYAALQGTEYIAYTEGDQTVSVHK